MFPYDMTIHLYRGDDPIGEQVYRFEPLERAWEVRQIARSTEHPDASSTCILTVMPDRYASVDVRLRRGSERVSLQVMVDEQRTLVLDAGDRRTEHSVADTRVLFDGPGPIFDCINAVLILGICDGEEMLLPIHALDPEQGIIRRKLYRFSRHGRTISIAKGIDPLGDARILLDEDGFGVVAYQAAGYRYRFAGTQWT